MNIFLINFFDNWKLCLSLHPQLSGYGEIGRHARLRIWCRKACRFESYYPHYLLLKSLFIFYQINRLFSCLIYFFTNFRNNPKKYLKNKRSLSVKKGFFLKAVWTGLEPATPCVTGMYSNQLNYQTHCFIVIAKIQ